MIRTLLVLSIVALAGFARADPLKIAVASNFEDAFAALVTGYAKRSDEKIEATYGSTGALYAQIVAGAPFVALFAADSERTAKLVGAGRAKAASRMVYAIGHLVLWTPDPDSGSPEDWLADEHHRVAIADPELAPYGAAAQQTLTALKLWQLIQPRLVKGESAAQVVKSVATSAADGGFVAEAQLIARFHGTPPAAEIWRVPQTLYTPIVQEAVVLETPSAARAQAFLTYVGSDDARAIITAHGYAVLAPSK